MEIDDYNKWLELLKNEEDDEKIDAFLHGSEVSLTSNANTSSLANKKGEMPVLKPGGPGILGCFGRHPTIKGHFGLTQEILQNSSLNLSESVIESIARASRLPDVLHFTDLRYHAQSKAYGKEQDYLPINPDIDKFKFQTLLHKEISAAKNSLNDDYIKNSPERFAKDFCYHFGFVMHLVQDLACHQGMTNPEHAYLDKEKNNKGEPLSPDSDEHRYSLAKEATIFTINHHFTEQISKKSQQLNDFAKESKITWSKFDKLKQILNLIVGSIDFHINALESRRKEHQSRWFNWNARKIEQSLENMKPIIIG